MGGRTTRKGTAAGQGSWGGWDKFVIMAGGGTVVRHELLIASRKRRLIAFCSASACSCFTTGSSSASRKRSKRWKQGERRYCHRGPSPVALRGVPRRRTSPAALRSRSPAPDRCWTRRPRLADEDRAVTAQLLGGRFCFPKEGVLLVGSRRSEEEDRTF